MSLDLVIRGGTVVAAEGRARRDVHVSDGRVVGLTEPGEGTAAQTVDADGLLVLPGMVDSHVHFMDPGDPEREDFPTGTAAAAIHGITTVVEHTHAAPVTSVRELEAKLGHLRGRAWTDFGLAAHVWPDRIAELPALWRAGIAYFKAFTCNTHGIPAIDTPTLLDLSRTLVELDAPCLLHCEDDEMTAANEQRLRAAHREDGGIIPEWRSRDAELVSVAVVASIARSTGARLIVAHASSADVVGLIARERGAGAPTFAESCPQYLHLWEREVLEAGPFRKYTPPARIRSEAEERDMWEAFDSGLIHHLSSDHAPATREQKLAGGLWDVHFGLPGVDTTLALMVHAALEGRTTLERVVEAYAEAPARIYGLSGKGRLAPGHDADVVLVDPDGAWEVADSDIVSKAGWSPYSGRRLRGRIVGTLLRGRFVARDGSLVEDDRRGRWLSGSGRAELSGGGA